MTDLKVVLRLKQRWLGDNHLVLNNLYKNGMYLYPAISLRKRVDQFAQTHEVYVFYTNKAAKALCIIQLYIPYRLKCNHCPTNGFLYCFARKLIIYPKYQSIWDID